MNPLPLLLCIDLQPTFLAVVEDGHRVVWRTAFAIAAAQGLGLPVVFTEQVPGKLGGTAPDLLALCAQAEVFGKSTFSALGDEVIAARLRASGARHLLLAGIETPVCVYETASAALQAGYRVTVLSDAVGGRRPGDAAVALAQLRHAGCSVLPAETVFYSLLGGATHPFFRSYTQLVRKYG